MYIIMHNNEVVKEFNPVYNDTVAFEEFMMKPVEFDSIELAYEYAKNKKLFPSFIIESISEGLPIFICKRKQ